MKAVIQRVLNASVHVNQKEVCAIDTGVLILLGVAEGDTETDIKWLSKKIANLRIFNDENGLMNSSIIDIKGAAIVVSQFTLLANTKKGNRPSYIKAAKPEKALGIYQEFIKQIESDLGKKVGTGVFGAMMEVKLANDGPVTILIDSQNRE